MIWKRALWERTEEVALALVDRHPTWSEVEQLRLVLRTFQDGYGQQAISNSELTLPGWRDFERAVASVFGGEAQESKAIYDVLISSPVEPSTYYGISCKMRGTLDQTNRTERVTIEVSNSYRKFWNALNSRGLYHSNYRDSPLQVGATLIETVEGWHQEVGIVESGGSVNLDLSSYLILSYNRRGWYQLHQFRIPFPDPGELSWSFPSSRIIGSDATGVALEWYGESGGQLKYYPSIASAFWISDPFQLQPLPPGRYGLTSKAEEYFPVLWARAQGRSDADS